jgi:ATP-binding cassette subfamily B protein
MYMLKALKISAIFHPSVEFLTSLGTVIVVGYGGFLAFTSGLAVYDIMAFLLYLSLLYAPITALATLIENAQATFAGAERVLAIIDEASAVVDKEDAVEIQQVKGHIKFEDVSFDYIDGVPVFNDISFEARPGQTIALVGPTGVGKTTMINLVARFYDPKSGSITLDGMDLKDISQKSLRNQMSMVLQDTFLFNGSIAQNIAYALPNASLDQIKEAAKIADIYEDIMNMPDGFETEIGERGLRLSGGQKQRLAIARAMINDPKVILADEPTGNLDPSAADEVMNLFRRIVESGCAIVMSTHNIGNIQQYPSRTIRFHNGKVEEIDMKQWLMVNG